jgi:transcriptional regulator with XRE-family HTH domain
MTAIKLLNETKETVTLKRTDFEALLRTVEDTADLAAVDTHRAYENRVGWEAARRDYLTAEEARRLLDGESPVRVWREKRGISQRALAEAAEVSASYLAEIEGGKKPGSSGTLQRVGRILEVPMESLIGTESAKAGPGPISLVDLAAERLVRLATDGTGRNRLGAEAHAIASEWRTTTDERGGPKYIVALQALTSWLRKLSADWRRQSIALDQSGERQAAIRMRDGLDALEGAIDALRAEYR